MTVNAQSLLTRAQKMGISLRIVGEQIRYRPRASTPPEFVEELKNHKAEVMELLTEPEALGTDVESHEPLGVWPDTGTCKACLCETFIIPQPECRMRLVQREGVCPV